MSDGCNSCQGGIPRAAGGGGQGFGATPPFFFMGQAVLNVSGSTAPEEVQALANLTLDQQGIFSQYVACPTALQDQPPPPQPLTCAADIVPFRDGPASFRIRLSVVTEGGRRPVTISGKARMRINMGDEVEVADLGGVNSVDITVGPFPVRELQDTVRVSVEGRAEDSTQPARQTCDFRRTGELNIRIIR